MYFLKARINLKVHEDIKEGLLVLANQNRETMSACIRRIICNELKTNNLLGQQIHPDLSIKNNDTNIKGV